MTVDTKLKSELPTWLREAIETGEPMTSLPDHRREPRRVCVDAFLVQPEKNPTAEKLVVQGFNVNSYGIGFIAQKDIGAGQRLALVPSDDPKEHPVWVRVVHSTKTAEGHKVGCAFEAV